MKKLNKITDFENSMRDKKAQELKRGRDEMLKWTQQLKKVSLLRISIF